ncbi:DnaB C-terminal domain-containing protein [Butyrivibrio proteoclasticus B316]|uniref:DnaB C-terminal domain-containing protein n=1 Tax=Butyrivibrio proteoclasticus (strain ATCC 51982 / DSM 14932 / B316) TaxID=515622 RepID=E0S315_BUTPB|nr:DnaB-like helicase C-terminal domain-containing protein [Butyrivibrio proteoclasticus]ADL35797.1 DnaB C-terminal domain-containing protein [Butyrivibrio proteoclasticus B316]
MSEPRLVYEEYTLKDNVKFNLENRITRAKEGSCKTGFRDFDKLTGGFRPAELTIIAGRPAMGKTSFILNCVQHIALANEMKVGLFMAREGSEKLVNMLLAMEAHVEIKHIETEPLNATEMGRVNEAADLLSDADILYESPCMYLDKFNLDDLYNCFCQFAICYGVQVIFVDSLQSIEVDGASDPKDRYLEIVKTLRDAAILLEIPIVLVSNLPDTLEQREDKKPRETDLREYGPIDRYADTIVLLHYDEYYDRDTEKKGVAEISIAKNISGHTGEIDLLWLPQYLKYCNLEKGY